MRCNGIENRIEDFLDWVKENKTEIKNRNRLVYVKVAVLRNRPVENIKQLHVNCSAPFGIHKK